MENSENLEHHLILMMHEILRVSAGGGNVDKLIFNMREAAMFSIAYEQEHGRKSICTIIRAVLGLKSTLENVELTSAELHEFQLLEKVRVHFVRQSAASFVNNQTQISNEGNHIFDLMREYCELRAEIRRRSQLD